MLTPEEQSVLDHLLAKRQPEQPTVKSVYFHNWTNEDFTHTWGKVPYTIKAGDKVMMEDWLARHLAKHLAERALNNENNKLILQQKIAGKEGKDIKEINILFSPLREQYIKAAMGEIELEAANTTELAVKMANLPDVSVEAPEISEPVLEVPKKKGRPAKVVEKEFEDLEATA